MRTFENFLVLFKFFFFPFLCFFYCLEMRDMILFSYLHRRCIIYKKCDNLCERESDFHYSHSELRYFVCIKNTVFCIICVEIRVSECASNTLEYFQRLFKKNDFDKNLCVKSYITGSIYARFSHFTKL